MPQASHSFQLPEEVNLPIQSSDLEFINEAIWDCSMSHMGAHFPAGDEVLSLLMG